MAKRDFRHLSDNELSEGMQMCATVLHTIERDYAHTPTPLNVIKAIASYQHRLFKEYDCRAEENEE